MVIDAINGLEKPWNVIVWVALGIAVIIVCFLLTSLNKLIFKRIQRKNNGVHLVFLQHLISTLIVLGLIILIISSFAGVQTVWTTIFGGTAIVSAVVAFAAQDIIKDVLAGLMISAHRPFRIGDRITLEDGTAGIVEEMTLRHVVLKGVESMRYVVPNHVINSMRLSHYSFHTVIRSITFRFSVGYDSDMGVAKKAIASAVKSSEYTIAGYVDKDGKNRYGGVYFMSFADSALILQVTAYYEQTTPTEKVIDDVNVKVRKALIENGVEIPYNYVNVVQKEETIDEELTNNTVVAKEPTKTVKKQEEKDDKKTVSVKTTQTLEVEKNKKPTEQTTDKKSSAVKEEQTTDKKSSIAKEEQTADKKTTTAKTEEKEELSKRKRVKKESSVLKKLRKKK